MINPRVLEEFERMSVAERVQLVQDLWDLIAESPQDVPSPTEAQRAELDRRLAAHAQDPERVLSADEVFARLRDQRASD